jgi:outer membrane protein assembly factor BamB
LVALEPHTVCSLAVPTGSIRWCSSLPGQRSYVGHSTPTISDGLVLLTALPDSSGADILRQRSWKDRLSWVGERLFGSSPAHYGEHELWALDLATGATRWTALLGGGHPPYGHTAGTPVIIDGVAVVTSPVAQAVAGVDPRTGRVLWRHSAPSRLRGPVAAWKNLALWVAADGSAFVANPRTGDLLCRWQVGFAVDRAGPTVVEDFAILAGLDGDLASVALERSACALGVPD